MFFSGKKLPFLAFLNSAARQPFFLFVFAPRFDATFRTETGKLRCFIELVAKRVGRKSAALHPLLHGFKGNSQRVREVLLSYESSLCKPPHAKGLRERSTTRMFRCARFGVSLHASFSRRWLWGFLLRSSCDSAAAFPDSAS